ncbi:hypothetical protein L204_100008 [Cryptococcus depauperatus]
MHPLATKLQYSRSTLFVHEATTPSCASYTSSANWTNPSPKSHAGPFRIHVQDSQQADAFSSGPEHSSHSKAPKPVGGISTWPDSRRFSTNQVCISTPRDGHPHCLAGIDKDSSPRREQRVCCFRVCLGSCHRARTCSRCSV